MQKFNIAELGKIILILLLILALPGCSALGSLFGAFFGLAGDVLSWGMAELPRLLPYLLFLVERQPLPEEEEILVAQKGENQVLPASSNVITNHLMLSNRLEMVIAVPEEGFSEAKKAELLQNLKGYEVKEIRVNGCDLEDQLVSLESLGQALAQESVTFIGPEKLAPLAKNSYVSKTSSELHEKIKKSLTPKSPFILQVAPVVDYQNTPPRFVFENK